MIVCIAFEAGYFIHFVFHLLMIGMTPLMRAARYNQGAEQVLLLLKYGADVNAMTDSRNDYRTVLHYAVLSGSLSLVNLLLKQGAKTDRLPPDGETDKPSPLHLAILRGDPAILRLLIEAGNAYRQYFKSI